MKKEYTPEQLKKIYQKLPPELQEVIFSEETANNIWDICERNGIKDAEEKSAIAGYVGYILHGILLLDDFPKTLEKDLKLKKEVAKKIAQEINRFIFYPVKSALEQFYKIGVSEEEKEKIPAAAPALKTAETPSAEVPAVEEKKPTATPGKDTYRESIE